MKNDKKMAKMTLKTETVKVLGVNELSDVAGGGLCSTGAPSGLCPTHTSTCPRTNGH